MSEKDSDPEITPEVWDHGGPAPGEEALCRLDASTTVNPFPSGELLARLAQALSGATRYPDPFAEEGLAAARRRYGLPPGRIAAAGGATLLLYALIGAGGFSRIVLPAPVFSEYRRAASIAGSPVLSLPPAGILPWSGRISPFLRDFFSGEGLPWGIEIGEIAGLRAGDLVVLVNPVNPTGQEFSREEVLDLFRRAQEAGASLLVDESFQDFLGDRTSVIDRAGEGALFVLRSLTKITGLPGVRVGLLAGPREPVGKVRERIGPWALGTLEQSLLLWAMEAKKEGFGYRPEAKERLVSLLLSGGWTVCPGEGPFVLASPGRRPEECQALKERLWRQGVRLRLATGFGVEGGEMLFRLGFGAFLSPEALGEALESPG